MSHDHQRSDQHQHHRRKHRETASERGNEHDENHARQPAEAGVATDTRWGDDEESFDIEGHVLHAEVSRGGSRITIARGRADGVHLGMEGYLRSQTGDVLGDFVVESVDKRYCKAIVRVRTEDVEGATAVVNPSRAIPSKAELVGMSHKSREKVLEDAAKNGQEPTTYREQRGRIMRVTVGSDGLSRIVISGGLDMGFAPGMHGYVCGEGGQPIEHFTLDQVDGRSCHASVRLAPDALQQHKNVVVFVR